MCPVVSPSGAGNTCGSGVHTPPPLTGTSPAGDDDTSTVATAAEKRSSCCARGDDNSSCYGLALLFGGGVRAPPLSAAAWLGSEAPASTPAVVVKPKGKVPFTEEHLKLKDAACDTTGQ